MLDDLDRTLETLLRVELPRELAQQLAICFIAPDADFPPASVKLPALNLFLYDIREDPEGRTGDWEIVRDSAGSATGRRPVPTCVACSYLITAWSNATTDPAWDEHRLLGETLRVLVRRRELPVDVLHGSLTDHTAPLPVTSLAPGRLESIAEFWQACGGRPKAALTLTVSVWVDEAVTVTAGPPVQETVLELELLDNAH
jgi:hypothetical protein